MSMNNKNLFDLLGNDVEDDTVESLPPKELVRKTTSSKKTDTPPASANAAKANKNRPKATGNEAAIKSKPNNRGTEAPVPTSKSTGGAKTDRKNKTGKTDSSKKLKKSWGDDSKELETELAAEIDAKHDLEDDSENLVEQAKNLKSVEEYFQELKLQQDQLQAKSIRKVANDGSSEVLIKETENFYNATSKKNQKQKQQKVKKFLDVNAIFSDEAPSSSSAPRGGASRGRGGQRGGRGGNRGGAAAASKRVSNKAVVVDDNTFPSLS